MRLFAALVAGFALAGPLRAADEPAKPNTLTPQEIADGWLLLFDGETTYGWSIDGPAKVENGVLILGGDKPVKAACTTKFGAYQVAMEVDWRGTTPPQMRVGSAQGATKAPEGKEFGGLAFTHVGPPESPAEFSVPAGTTVRLRALKILPLQTKAIFNGKDLAGWRKYTGDAKRSTSQFTVTPEGWLHVKDGPGDLQTEGQWADFVLQIECISIGPHLNSGVFFRCLPNQYQNGYEAQIRNQWEGDDRTRPVDFGTGAIYRRQPARKVVSSDRAWFTMTIVAVGNHIATWVNGYQVTDFADTRPANENARQGSKTGPGCISLQGHDPTTDLSFRNIRIADLAEPKK